MRRKKYFEDYSAITITHFVQTVQSCHKKNVHIKAEYGQTEHLIWSQSNNDLSLCLHFVLLWKQLKREKRDYVLSGDLVHWGSEIGRKVPVLGTLQARQDMSRKALETEQ
jgi:hypothetical protein